MLTVLIFLGILGTGFAAYMLEAHVLLALMVVALAAWMAGFIVRGARTLTSVRVAP
jgi:hypothetical protein